MKKLLVVVMMLAAAAGAAELTVGAQAPKFSLVNAVDSKPVSVTPGDGKVHVVIFTCNQCPFAKAFEPRIIELANQYQARGVKFYAVDPNDDTRYPEETLESMRTRAIAKNYPFPYLKDGDSSTARAYGATVTPHVYVIDGKGAIRYRGYVDNSPKPEERKTTGLSDVLDALLANRAVEKAETKAFGCSIKWKA